MPIVAVSGKQFLVKTGDKIKTFNLNKKDGEILELPDLLSQKKVTARVLKTEKGEKIRVFKDFLYLGSVEKVLG